MSNHNSITLSSAVNKFSGEVVLTGSKSECNRALILNALSNGAVKVENISASADTITLKEILSLGSDNPKSETNVGPAGTAMRFLTAYFAVIGYPTTLTGSARMKERPIGILVDALRILGSDIGYAENEGFPPLTIPGNFVQKTSTLTVKGNISSQYISALLLVAPHLPAGLTLAIEGELTSKPYVEMTLAMLKETGIDHTWDGNKISIAHQQFKQSTIYVEPDWSAASYWYSIIALSAIGSKVFLKGLRKESLQGDSRISEIMEKFGVVSTFDDSGVIIEKVERELEASGFDLKSCPDLAQTIVVLSGALKLNCTFIGLETLKIKETDRVKALQTELRKIGVDFIETNETYHLDCSNLTFPETIKIETYDDHRMAMAFAPLAMRIKTVKIEDPDVVAKSYPDFWKDLKNKGFIITN